MNTHQTQGPGSSSEEGFEAAQSVKIFSVTRVIHSLLRDLRSEIERGEKELDEHGGRVPADPAQFEAAIKAWVAGPSGLSIASREMLGEFLEAEASEEAVNSLAGKFLGAFYEAKLKDFRTEENADMGPAVVLDGMIASAYSSMLSTRVSSLPADDVWLGLMQVSESFLTGSMQILGDRQGSLERVRSEELFSRADRILEERENAACLKTCEGAAAARLLLDAALDEREMREALAVWCRGLVEMAWESGSPEEEPLIAVTRILNRLLVSSNLPPVSLYPSDEPLPPVPLGQCLDLLERYDDGGELKDFEAKLGEYRSGRVGAEQWQQVLRRAGTGLQKMEDFLALRGIDPWVFERSVRQEFKEIADLYGSDPAGAHARLMTQLDPHWQETVPQTLWRLARQTFKDMFPWKR